MILSNPPTDNLYKFLFIAGIVTVLLALHEVNQQEQSYYRRANAVFNESAEFTIDSMSNALDIRQIKKEIQLLSSLCDCDLTEGGDSLLSVPLPLPNDTEQVRMHRAIMTYIDRYNESTNDLSKRYLLAQIARKALARSADEVAFFTRWLQLMVLVGFVMFAVGGRAWYRKVQRYEDIIQKVAGLKAKKELDELTNDKQ
ncbi:MAG: hypothetical protein IPN44_00155 [Flavobacteriales bacterium]|nr:hypothetical protein [Flavobacteriales bacterium]